MSADSLNTAMDAIAQTMRMHASMPCRPWGLGPGPVGPLPGRTAPAHPHQKAFTTCRWGDWRIPWLSQLSHHINQSARPGRWPSMIHPPVVRTSSCLVSQFSPKFQKKKILRHIKISANAWSTKYWWNQKLIAQFYCTLRDEHFKPS
jgi:hypothetical protein